MRRCPFGVDTHKLAQLIRACCHMWSDLRQYVSGSDEEIRGRAERGPLLFIVLGLSMVFWRADGDEAAVS